MANIDDVIDIAIVPTFPKSFLISSNGKQLLQCDLRHLQTRSKASVCLNTGLDFIELDLPFVKANSHDFWRFVKIFDNTDRNQEISDPIAIAATQTQIVILRYDIENKYFKAVRSLDTAKPVQSIYFTPCTAIVSSDKFFEIDLQSLKPEEFLDESDQSVLHALASKPMHTFAINQEEFLLCFKEFGIYVDEFGRRTRPNDVKWMRIPTEFEYRAPILFIASDDGVQMMRIHKSFTNELDEESNDEKLLQTFISANNVRLAAHAGKYGVLALTSTESTIPSTTSRSTYAVAQQLVRFDGTKALRNALSDSIETILSSDTDY